MESSFDLGFACARNPDKHDLWQYIWSSGNKTVWNLRKSVFCLLLTFLLFV